MLQFLAIWLPLRQDDKISSHGQQTQIMYSVSRQMQVYSAKMWSQVVVSSTFYWRLLPVLVTSLDNIYTLLTPNHLPPAHFIVNSAE